MIQYQRSHSHISLHWKITINYSIKAIEKKENLYHLLKEIIHNHHKDKFYKSEEIVKMLFTSIINKLS